MYVSKRKDLNITGLDAIYYIYEMYILHVKKIINFNLNFKKIIKKIKSKEQDIPDQSTDKLETVVPVSLHISAPLVKFI